MNSLFALLREGFEAPESLVEWPMVSHILTDGVAMDGACTKLSLNKGHVDDENDAKHAPVFAGI